MLFPLAHLPALAILMALPGQQCPAALRGGAVWTSSGRLRLRHLPALAQWRQGFVKGQIRPWCHAAGAKSAGCALSRDCMSLCSALLCIHVTLAPVLADGLCTQASRPALTC